MSISTAKRSAGKYILPAVLFFFTTAYLLEAMRNGAPMRNNLPTASFFPIFLSTLMYFCLILEFSTIIRRQRREEERAGTGYVLKAIAGILITGGYIGAFAAFGFTFSTLVFSWLLLTIFGYGELYSLGGNIRKVIAAIAITAMVYLLFSVAFDVRMPEFWR